MFALYKEKGEDIFHVKIHLFPKIKEKDKRSH